MSIRIMSLVWNTKLSSTEKLVLLYYADRAADDGSSIFPAVKTVARNTGLCERTVQQTTKKLIKSGYLIREGWSNYRTKKLRIIIPKLLQDNQQTPSEIGELDGCTTFAQGVQMTAKRGERAAPKPSIAISKPSSNGNFSKNYRKPAEYYSEKYNPTIDPDLKKALQRSKEQIHT